MIYKAHQTEGLGRISTSLHLPLGFLLFINLFVQQIFIENAF